MLTLSCNQYNLDLSFPHEAVRIGVLNIAAQPQTCGFFVSEIPVYHAMTGWMKHSQEWLVAMPVRQLRSVCLPMIGVVWRQVFNLLTGIAIMKSHTTKLTNHVSKKSTSRFNVLTRSGRSIARKVPFSTAIQLKNKQPELSIKFDSMAVSA